MQKRDSSLDSGQHPYHIFPLSSAIGTLTPFLVLSHPMGHCSTLLQKSRNQRLPGIADSWLPDSHTHPDSYPDLPTLTSTHAHTLTLIHTQTFSPSVEQRVPSCVRGKENSDNRMSSVSG